MAYYLPFKASAPPGFALLLKAQGAAPFTPLENELEIASGSGG
jgi:hypothetical protein